MTGEMWPARAHMFSIQFATKQRRTFDTLCTTYYDDCQMVHRRYTFIPSPFATRLLALDVVERVRRADTDGDDDSTSSLGAVQSDTSLMIILWTQIGDSQISNEQPTAPRSLHACPHLALLGGVDG